MKVHSSIVAAFVVGAAIASLPYTLSSGKTVAQAAGPGQAQGGLGGGGFGGGGQQGNTVFPPGQGFPGQLNRQGGGQMVSTMTVANGYLFAAAGDTIYKINTDSMSIMGQTKLPAPRAQQQPGQGGLRGGAGRPPQGGGGGGLGGANGGTVPPKK